SSRGSDQCPLLPDRETHDKRCAVGLHVVMAQNLSTVLSHNSVADAQAQPRSFADFLGRKKRIKDPIWMRDAMPVIAEGNLNEAAGGSCRNLNTRLTADFAHSVICIVENIQKDLLKLVRVTNYARQLLIKVLNNFYSMALEVVGAQLHRAMENRVKLHRF